MGNCLRSPRNVLDPMLMTDESSPVAIGPNQPLQTTPEVWRTEVPWTEGQLRSKRDTFWETAPAYDGRREIWDALKAACEAAEEGDYGLAQVILDGANVSLPTGRLVEAYDELGNRYVLPKYCISKPTNLAGSVESPPLPRPSGAPAPSSTTQAADTDDSNEIDSGTNLLQDPPATTIPTSNSASSASGLRQRTSSATNRSKASKRKSSKSKSSSKDVVPPPVDIAPTGDPVVVKIRVSTLPKDIKMTLQASDRVRDLKRRLEAEHEVAANRITMLYSGRVLHDRTYIKQLDIPKGFIIQAIVN